MFIEYRAKVIDKPDMIGNGGRSVWRRSYTCILPMREDGLHAVCWTGGISFMACLDGGIGKQQVTKVRQGYNPANSLEVVSRANLLIEEVGTPIDDSLK